MDERLRCDLLQSPVYGFVQDKWLVWSQDIYAVQMQEQDFLLCLLWGLDLIKDERDDVAKTFRARVYKGVRDLFIARQFSSNQNDLKTITDFVCASSLFCFGLVLTGDFDNQKLYGELMKGFDKDNVMVEWGKIEMDSNTPALKTWMEEYMKSDEYYTSGEKIEWLEQEPENLPDIVRIARGPVQIMQVNIGQFNNAPGATFTDKSLNVKIEGNNGEYRKIQ
jgi:hypothetical protein